LNYFPVQIWWRLLRLQEIAGNFIVGSGQGSFDLSRVKENGNGRWKISTDCTSKLLYCTPYIDK